MYVNPCTYTFFQVSLSIKLQRYFKIQLYINTSDLNLVQVSFQPNLFPLGRTPDLTFYIVFTSLFNSSRRIVVSELLIPISELTLLHFDLYVYLLLSYPCSIQSRFCFLQLLKLILIPPNPFLCYQFNIFWFTCQCLYSILSSPIPITFNNVIVSLV